MKKLVLATVMILGSMKSVLLLLILSTMIMLDLSASQINKSEFTFPRWKSLHKLNTEALKSDAHSAWFDLYVNRLAKKAYVEKLSLYPVGSLVMKPHYSNEERSGIAKLTIMLKMKKGYDTEHGDWWYGVYDETGMKGSYQGKIKSCIKCHTQVKETDYMFSESVMESINDMTF